VYEFRPAPGQFVNELPEYAPGDTQADMIRKVEAYIAGEHHNEGMVSLGGYGGYLVFGFDHEVENKPGQYDFKILANAFYADANPNQGASREGGSCEPGIVMVARDANANGIPDDPWYELAGSEYRSPQTVHNYRITYYRPDENKPRAPHPTDPNLNDTTYIRWTTNGQGEGYLYRNIYHNQSYYPQWITDETLTFEGARLADNYIDESGQGNYYVQYAYHWGYADNQPNANARAGFNIEWAVDAEGMPVNLPGIHFVKVYTGVNQYCGWLGETSTEITGAEDLHLTGRSASVPVFTQGITLDRTALTLTVGQTTVLTATILPANATDQRITWRSSAPAVAQVSSSGTLTALAPGTATIQAITLDGYRIAACALTVASPSAPDPEPGAVTGVTLDHATLAMRPGETAQLTATVAPGTATDRSLSWQSSRPDVAEVTVSGRVIAFAEGEATITVTTGDGLHTATCRVSVSLPTSAEAPTEARAQAVYASGSLRLLQLEGYDCTLLTPYGHVIDRFTPTSPDYVRTLDLPAGVYIITARNNARHITLKLVSKR
jgi:uncharacterized protein YjdB